MIDRMPTQLTNLRGRTSWRALLGILCLVFLLVGTTIAASHIHLDSDLSHADCALCATAHTAAAPVATFIAVSGIQVFGALELQQFSSSRQNSFSFALFTRPPPADAHLS